MLSPNFGTRRNGLVPDLVVIHYTAMESCAAACARLCDPEAEVSAHYLIGYDGRVISLVAEEARAWHAGAGSWRGLNDINSRSIGIELANTGGEPFPEPQMAALETLLREILARWAIPPRGVIAHSDMAPDRKSDPGRRFDWQRLAMSGLAVWPEADLPRADLACCSPVAGSCAPLAEFRSWATAFGYPPVAGDALLSAFRLRFRPWANGPCAPQDVASARNLALRFGVDPGTAEA